MNKKLLAVLAVATIAGQAHAFDAKGFAANRCADIKGAFKLANALLNPYGSFKDQVTTKDVVKNYKLADQTSSKTIVMMGVDGTPKTIEVDAQGKPVTDDQNGIAVNDKATTTVTIDDQLQAIQNKSASKSELVWYARHRMGWTGNALATVALVGTVVTAKQGLDTAANFFSNDEDEDEEEDA